MRFWKQMGTAMLTAVVTVVLVFGIAALSSRAQSDLAKRVDNNTKAILCVLLIEPAHRTHANIAHCVGQNPP